MRFARLACLFAVLATVPQAFAESGAESGESAGIPRDLCDTAALRAEQAEKLPRFLLHAISLAESGRWDAKTQARFAWPWTVTAGGEGRFFPTKEAAIRHVEALRRQGRTNIDVGCMQINLHYHDDAFETLDQAFDPSANVAYGAHFLAGLIADRRSWARAIAQYHSSTRSRGRAYSRKVFAIWNQERRRLLEKERLAKIAAYRRHQSRLQLSAR